MSTYYNPANPSKLSYDDCPEVVKDYLNYMLTIRGLSARTVNAYYVDLRTFFKYLVHARGIVSEDIDFDKIDISFIDISFVAQINKKEILEFLFYVTQNRANSAATRSRKISSLKGYFKYLCGRTGRLDKNPMDDIEMPSQKKRLPKYLTLDESITLLKNIQSDYIERDYCILTLFLNCGMRLSELVFLNNTDIKDDTIRVIGKGNKERIVYLNSACITALNDLLDANQKLENVQDKKALFVSKKTKKRLSARRVQQIVERCLDTAGLSEKGYSVHKLRHTAATLMYQHGGVDMLSLKEILGHVDVSTTQIYTHLDSAQLKKAAASSPLARIKKSQDK